MKLAIPGWSMGWLFALAVLDWPSPGLADDVPLQARVAAVSREGVTVNSEVPIGLVVNAPDFSDRELLQVVERVPEITTMRIGAGNLSDRGFAALRKLRNLEILEIRTSINDAGIIAIQGIPSLKRLILEVPMVEPAPPFNSPPPRPRISDKAFVNAKSWKSLEVLTVSVPDFLGDVPLPGNSFVKDRKFGTILTDATLKNLSQCRKLNRIEIHSASMITDGGIKALSSLPDLNALVLMSCQGITDASAPTLGRMMLRELVLTGTSYTNKGTAALIRMSPKTHLADSAGQYHDPRQN